MSIRESVETKKNVRFGYEEEGRWFGSSRQDTRQKNKMFCVRASSPTPSFHEPLDFLTNSYESKNVRMSFTSRQKRKRDALVFGLLFFSTLLEFQTETETQI